MKQISDEEMAIFFNLVSPLMDWVARNGAGQLVVTDTVADAPALLLRHIRLTGTIAESIESALPRH